MSWLDTITGILFVGHSLFGPTNPQMLNELLPDTPVAAQIINGAPLKYNWTNAADAEFNARDALPSGRYNVVILTEAIPLAEHLEWSRPAEHAGLFHALATGADPRARVFLQETWHSLHSGTGREVAHDDEAHIPWRERLDRDLPRWQGIVDAVNAARAPGSTAMALMPAGQAMARLHDEIAAGTVPGLDGIGAVFSDDIHLTETGHYFQTMLQYGVVTGQSPVGLGRELYDRWGGAYDTPDAALARRLQEIAWEVARETGAVTAAPPETEQTATAPAPAAEPSTPATPAVSPTPPPQAGGPFDMAIGLAGINDWSVQQPFLDVMKTARPWIGHLPGQWGGASHEDLDAAGYLDENGWPVEKPRELSSIGTLILTDLPEAALDQAGRYRLSFDGQGVIEVGGRAGNVKYGKGMVEFDFAPGPGAVDIRIQRTNRKGDHVRNITVVKLDHLPAFEAGGMFNPLWLDRLQGFAALRFMDWMKTNESTQVRWQDRPRPEDYTWAFHGAPVEVMVELANRTGADAWFNMPHAADDEYVRRFAELVKDRMWHEQTAYVEYSNEVWNWQFPQADWADAAAIDRWGANEAWIEFYGGRAAEMAQIWDDVFGAEAEARVVNVVATQTAWLGLEGRILNAPLWTGEETGRQPPHAHFDAYAITGYFGAILGLERHAATMRAWLAESRAQAEQVADHKGLTGEARDAFVARHRFDAASAIAGVELLDGQVNGDTEDNILRFLDQIMPYHKEVADRHGLDLIMYEGGSHVVGIGPMVEDAEITEFLIHFNYTPEMGALYSEMIRGWYARGGKLFNAFVDVYNPTKWGSWGTLRFLSDDNPRWDALTAFR